VARICGRQTARRCCAVGDRPTVATGMPAGILPRSEKQGVETREGAPAPAPQSPASGGEPPPNIPAEGGAPRRHRQWFTSGSRPCRPVKANVHHRQRLAVGRGATPHQFHRHSRSAPGSGPPAPLVRQVDFVCPSPPDLTGARFRLWGAEEVWGGSVKAGLAPNESQGEEGSEDLHSPAPQRLAGRQKGSCAGAMPSRKRTRPFRRRSSAWQRRTKRWRIRVFDEQVQIACVRPLAARSARLPATTGRGTGSAQPASNLQQSRLVRLGPWSFPGASSPTKLPRLLSSWSCFRGRGMGSRHLFPTLEFTLLCGWKPLRQGAPAVLGQARASTGAGAACCSGRPDLRARSGHGSTRRGRPPEQHLLARPASGERSQAERIGGFEDKTSIWSPWPRNYPGAYGARVFECHCVARRSSLEVIHVVTAARPRKAESHVRLSTRQAFRDVSTH